MSYPLFTTKGRPLSININDEFKDKDYIIGIYNHHYVVCLKETDNGIIILYDINDNNKQTKQYTNVCKKHKDCQKTAKIVDYDTVFVSCLHSDDYYHYLIINLSNDKIYESRDYFYGRAIPISNKELVEWSRVQLPSSQDPNVKIELIKVDCFNFDSNNGEFICAFRPIPSELFTQISLNKDKTRLFVGSIYKNDNHISVRTINNKSADEIIQSWVISSQDNQLISLKIQEPYLLILSFNFILIYNIANDKYWSIENEDEVEKQLPIIIESGSYITNIKNVLIHWNKHRIGNEDFLYLNFWDIQQGISIKSIKVDVKYASSYPPISITTNEDNSKLYVVNYDNQIHTLDFN